MLDTTQDWFFSVATGLPEYMIAYIPDSTHKPLFRRHIYQFQSSQTTNGVKKATDHKRAPRFDLTQRLPPN